MPYGSLGIKLATENYLKKMSSTENMPITNSDNYQSVATDTTNMVEYKGKEVIIMACSNCNINCKHCYISYKGNRTAEELLQIVKTLKSKYELNINGAEVLTNPEYLQSYKEIGQHFVLTNGKAILINPKIIEKFKENDIYSVSMSYHFGIQDEISSMKVDDLKKVLEILKLNEIRYRLLTTITSDNYSLIPYMCQEAYNLGADGIKFTNFLSQGNAIEMSNGNILSTDEIQEVLYLIKKEREKYSISDLIIERCGTFGANPNEKDNFNCNCITNSVVLAPDNNIYPCVFLTKPGYEIGEYTNGQIYLFDNYDNNCNTCLAKEICNENKQLILKRGNNNEKN